MVNPWTDVPQQPPYWLACDIPYIIAFNATANENHVIRAQPFPEPFHGNFLAPVVLLFLNPRSDDEFPRPPNEISTLRQEFSSPTRSGRHLHLGSDAANTPGGDWWASALRQLIQDIYPASLEVKLLTLEFSAYHSKSFGHGHLRLPSQEFTFRLLNEAIKRNALVICMRGEPLWTGAVPALHGYPDLCRVKNWRSASISRGNFERYDDLLRKLRDSDSDTTG